MQLKNYLGQFRSRKAHIYCIGAAKTGTTSIAQMYNGCLRTAHEPDVYETTDLVMRYLKGDISPNTLATECKSRDKRLNLELESSHPLGYLSSTLVDMFPNSKYIVTVRDAHSWLRSRLNFHQNRSPQEWQKYRDFIWSKHHEGYAPEEKVLEQNGLYSIDAYLKQYSEQYKIIFDAIPESKMLVVKTRDISNKVHEMNSFIGLEAVDIKAVHTNKMNVRESLFDAIPHEFISSRIDQHCGWLQQRFFSDKESE